MSKLPEAFVTANSGGGNYFVSIKCHSMADMHRWHDAVLAAYTQSKANSGEAIKANGLAGAKSIAAERLASVANYRTIAKGENEGWIEWNGGECPVDADTPVDVRFRGGMEWVDTGIRAGEVSGWIRMGGHRVTGDIIAYRMLEHPAVTQNGIAHRILLREAATLIRHLQSQLEAEREECAKLETALQPFAKAAEMQWTEAGDDFGIYGITGRHVRAAAAAIRSRSPIP